ncbi:MAG: hypothetical protein OEY56_05425, partial [Cyclobacteriaceae bacterium]|nr:hypothetical protein [Cyclobacteriaceae bacterium]
MTFLKLILRSALVISILIACNHRLLGIDFNKINTGYWYDVEAPVRVQHRVAQLHDSLYVFVRIQADSAIHTFNHLLQKDMADPDNHLLFAGIDTLSHSINEIVYRIAFRVPPQKLLVVHFIGQTDQFYFPIDLSRGNYSHPDYYPAGTDGRPVFDSYLVPGKFEFRFLGMPDTLFCFQYPEDFPAADPPMNASPILSPSLVPDSLLRVYGKPELADGNMYFVQKDTLSAIASAFYCA